MDTNTLGHSVRRVEDARFLTGHGRFVDDFAVPGAAHGHVLRSPHAHAVIERHRRLPRRDRRRACSASLPRADLAADGIGPLPCVAQVATVDPLIVPPRYALARGRVRHAGDPVAFVVAESRDRARDAAELIASRLPRCSTPSPTRPRRLCAGAPQIWDEAPGNLVLSFPARRQVRDRGGLRRRRACRRDRARQQPGRADADRAARRDRPLRRRRRRSAPAADRPRRPRHPQPARECRVSSARRAHPPDARPMSAAALA